MMNNTRPYRISAAAGTALAGTSFFDSCHYLPQRNSFTTSLAFIAHMVLLDQAFAHCPRFLTAASIEDGPYLSPIVVDRPFRPTKDFGLGKQLPHQLPNPTFDNLLAT